MDNEIIPLQVKPKSNRFVLMIFFVLLCLILAGLGFCYFQLIKNNVALEKKVAADAQQIVTMQTEMQRFVALAEKTENIAASQEKIMSDWSAVKNGNYDPFYLAEIRTYIQNANDSFQINHSKTIVLSLLKRVQFLVSQIKNSPTITFSNALSEKITTINALPDLDVSLTYQQLSALDKKIDALALPINPINTAQTVNQEAGLTWWQAGVAQFKHALTKLVVVHRNDKQAMPLILPEEKKFLYLNLHNQMQFVMWGLLQRNNAVYQAGLQSLTTWVQAYFVQDAAETKDMLQALAALQNVNVDMSTVNVADLLDKLPAN